MRLDDRSQAMQAAAQECAAELRAVALAVDRDPAQNRLVAASPAVRALQRLGLPPDEDAGPGMDEAPERGLRCIDTVVAVIELAAGDASVMLSVPGAALAGMVVGLMGDDDQRRYFNSRIRDGQTWTFCAITEPEVGSDAARMTTALTAERAGGYRLNGVKRYVGNGSRGAIGVVFARTGPSPLAIRAAIVEADRTGFNASPLDMVGLRGARLSEMRFTDVPVDEHMLLGSHRSSVQRGIWGAVQAFNNMRVLVGAMALGTAIAVHEYVRGERRWPSRWEAAHLDAYAAEIEWVRALHYQAAVSLDANVNNGHAAALAKLEGVRLVRRATTRLPALLGPGALLEHPLLEKWWRDGFGFEFMEGTGNIQRLTLAQGFLKGKFTHHAAQLASTV